MSGSFHVDVSGLGQVTITANLSVEISDAVEADLMAAFPRAEVIIHQDPAGVEMPIPLAAT